MHEGTANSPRVALYCRVSTEEQREGQTIESQIRELEIFATEKKWTAVGVYKDEGWSGGILARPELDRLRDDASRGLFETVLINDVDRLARDVTHLGIIKRDLERNGVHVIFRKVPGEQSPAQNLLINILGSFAEFEKELIADRTRRGKRHKVEVRKQFLGSIPPYGFLYMPKHRSPSGEGRLQIQPSEAAVVQQMYRWVDEQSLSARKVAEQLNENRMLPRKGGRMWQKSSVLRILRSEVYAGVWHYNKHQHCEPRKPVRAQRYRRSLRSSLRLRPKAEWLPVALPAELTIIEPAVWRRVQAQLDRNVTFSRRHAKHGYLLAGLVRCGGCNAAYVGEPSHGRFAYRCSRRCKQYSSIREELLNTTVWNAVKEALQKPDLIVRAIKDIRLHRRAELSRGEEEIHKGLNQLQAEEARILEAYRREILTPQQLARELQTLRARRAVLVFPKPPLAQTADLDKNVVRRSLEQYRQIVADKLETLGWERKQQILRTLLRRVVFEGDQVRIAGIIPRAEHAGAHTGRFATIASSHNGRNLDLQSLFDGPPGVVAPLEVAFELVRPVVRQPHLERSHKSSILTI